MLVAPCFKKSRVNPFCSRQKVSNQQAASERRAVKEDELPAELEQQGQRDEVRRRLSHLQQLAAGGPAARAAAVR